MKARPVIVYSILRLLAFLVPLGIMLIFPVFREMYWFALLFAALIGISLSVIFLQRPRAEFAEGVAARRDAKKTKATIEEQDAEVEDAANDALQYDGESTTDAETAPSDPAEPGSTDGDVSR